MRDGPMRSHTHWTWLPRDPIRHIYLEQHRETLVWTIRASSGSEVWEQQHREFSAAMRVIAGMIERTGGEKAWLRRGPDTTGARFS